MSLGSIFLTIWSTSYHHVTILVHGSWLHLLFTVASVHQRQVITTCPSHLQPVHQDKSCLDLLHLDHMTPCHVSCSMSSFIITCVSFATSPSHFHFRGLCCSHTYTYGLITYVSYINTISLTMLSPNYQNHTRTFQSPLFGNWWQHYKDMEIKLL